MLFQMFVVLEACSNITNFFNTLIGKINLVQSKILFNSIITRVNFAIFHK